MWVQRFTVFMSPFHCPPRSPSEADQLLPIYSRGSPGSQRGSDQVRAGAEPRWESRPLASDPGAIPTAPELARGGEAPETCPGPCAGGSPHPSGAHSVPGAGVPAGALGAAAAVAAAASEASTPALSQQREVGGDPGGGRREDGGVPRAAARGELCAHHHEHGGAAAGGAGAGRTGGGSGAGRSGCGAEGWQAAPRPPAGGTVSKLLSPGGCGGPFRKYLASIQDPVIPSTKIS